MAIPLSKTRRSGKTLYLSGELGFAADGTMPEGIAAQTRQCIENITATLAKEGLDLSNVLSCTCYLTDPADFADFNAVYSEMFPEPFPVRTTIGCALMIDAKVEITVIAEG
ncbi:RidA family protein [Salipiger abyssi]|uniref:Amidase, Asp-tRNAAsn/Glu-tRNAGln amidotransferase A subunit n=1 Tax=Salipiger abyssi TaxID=1250539 RepID=A0A1P8UM09_9RHOB|nr:RidA family protein [Salipiger abyssi]APZ50420.1 amidase, Asp-tRNAAsn/Glu-tRNAGln amidotransferase A subunit [Salipiger abyssi]MBN9887071.1 RidA family protein [Salipiger abyssi]